MFLIALCPLELYLQPRVVSQRGGESERVCEWQIDVQQFVLVQVEGEPDLGVPQVDVIDGVQDPADDEHVRHLVVTETDVPHVLYLKEGIGHFF